ncbi:hypothetical protein C2G38_2186843 [Gigaspora rosea]|uniref:Uncharacterized protein n=1 Tax=Gigaspora rosea TaxID=44941 RepID=A0A397V593_9GLOM|nr:hypothetical protein C2G38_2186843 [Gigaspora rosea]
MDIISLIYHEEDDNYERSNCTFINPVDSNYKPIDELNYESIDKLNYEPSNELIYEPIEELLSDNTIKYKSRVWRLREVVKVSPPKRQVDSSNPTGDVLKLNLRSVIVAYERLGAKPVTLVPPS